MASSSRWLQCVVEPEDEGRKQVAHMQVVPSHSRYPTRPLVNGASTKPAPLHTLLFIPSHASVGTKGRCFLRGMMLQIVSRLHHTSSRCCSPPSISCLPPSWLLRLPNLPHPHTPLAALIPNLEQAYRVSTFVSGSDPSAERKLFSYNVRSMTTATW